MFIIIVKFYGRRCVKSYGGGCGVDVDGSGLCEDVSSSSLMSM